MNRYEPMPRPCCTGREDTPAALGDGFRPIGEIGVDLVKSIFQPPGAPDDPRRIFRGRVIRAFRLSSADTLSRHDLGMIFSAARYPWIESEFSIMRDEGVLIRTDGAHGDEDLYQLSPEHS